MTGGVGHSGAPHHGYPTGGQLPGGKHYSTSSLSCMTTATNCDSGLVVWLNPSIRWILRDGADDRGDMGGPIQKGIVQYSVSSNAQVNHPGAIRH